MKEHWIHECSDAQCNRAFLMRDASGTIRHDDIVKLSCQGGLQSIWILCSL